MESSRLDRRTLWKAAALVLQAHDDGTHFASSALVAIFGMLSALLVGFLAARPLGSPVAGNAGVFPFLAVASTILTPVVVAVEERRTQALSFLRLLPQRIAPKWLLLLPFCAAGAAIALATVTVLPIPAALAWLGCWCWAAAVGHAFAGRRASIVVAVAWTASFLPVVAALALHRAVGWNAAATAALAFGVIGCLAAPRDRLITLVSAGSRRAAPQRTPCARTGQLFVARPTQVRGRWTALRILRITAATPPNRRANLSRLLPVAIGFTTLGVIMTWFWPTLPQGMTVCVQMMAAGRLVSAMSPTVVDFLSTRPISRGTRIRSSVLPWILMAAVGPCTALVRAETAATMPRIELASLAYPRATIRAAVAPAHAERGALPKDTFAVSPALRSLRVGQIERVSLLQLALFAGVAAGSLADGRGRRRHKWIAFGLTAISLLLLSGIWFPVHDRAWAATPLWFISLFSAVCAWALVRELRVGSEGAAVPVAVRS